MSYRKQYNLERRLRILEARAASFGLNTPPEIVIEIEDIQAELNRLVVEGNSSDSFSERGPIIYYYYKRNRSAVIAIIAVICLLGIGLWFNNYTTLFIPLQYPRMVVKDDFSAKKYSWPNDTYSYGNGTVITRGVTIDNTYFWQGVSDTGGGFFESPDHGLIFSDFAASVDARRTAGNNEAVYGISFRGQSNGVYRFEIRDTGEYEIVYQDSKNNKEFRLRPWTPAKLSDPGNFNTLSVVVSQNRFRFFINHRLVDELNDARLSEGSIAIFPTIPSKQKTSFEFDNFEVRESN